MKVENLVRNYKMVHSDRQDEEEIKVLKGLDFTIEDKHVYENYGLAFSNW